MTPLYPFFQNWLTELIPTTQHPFLEAYSSTNIKYYLNINHILVAIPAGKYYW
jgi:hypothetical protein